MNQRAFWWCALIGLELAASARLAAEQAISPYVDPSQLDCPWPKMSHYRQPWRGYLETRGGYEFLSGLGVNLHIPAGTEEVAIRLLAETGFKAFRIEAGWGELNWNETGWNNEALLRRRLELCAQYGIRPTLLLNAPQGVPCPVKFFDRRLLADARKGAKAVRLDSVKDLVVGRSGLSGLSDYWAAEALITSINAETGEVTLSKRLPKDLKAGPVPMATLKYAPLHPVASAEFDETAGGWVNYALRVCQLAERCGVKDYDVEIWNELTFGTHFLDINDYYDQTAPKIAAPQPNFLHSGGRCWELARRTTEGIKQAHPDVRVIWGFSNTTFYHCPIERLPPGTDGQSYHPYGTGTRKFMGVQERPDQSPLEGFVPTYELRLVEGWAPTFIQTECLMRLLRPEARLSAKPPGVSRFYHYMTEHGILASECGVGDAAGAWRLKALCATRSFCLWLNKGIDVLDYFDAYEPEATSYGLLPSNLNDLPPQARFEEVATPPMRAIRNLARAFGGSVPLSRIDPLGVEATSLGPETKVFEGDATHPPLWQREVLAVLPFQVNPQKHVVAVYLMTRDALKVLPPETFRLTFNGMKSNHVEATDVLSGAPVPIQFRSLGQNKVEVTVGVTEKPIIIALGE